MAGHQGEVEVVIDALRSADPALRSAAFGAALRLGIFDQDLAVRGLSDDAADVRRRVAELVARLDLDPASTQPTTLAAGLVALLDDDDDACAEVAAFALGELAVASEAVASALATQAADHNDPLCRESAVAALGALGVGREAVLAAMDDVATVRRRAVIALANFDGPDIDAALEGALDDRDWQVRQAAEDLTT